MFHMKEQDKTWEEEFSDVGYAIYPRNSLE